MSSQYSNSNKNNKALSPVPKVYLMLDRDIDNSYSPSKKHIERNQNNKKIKTISPKHTAIDNNSLMNYNDNSDILINLSNNTSDIIDTFNSSILNSSVHRIPTADTVDSMESSIQRSVITPTLEPPSHYNTDNNTTSSGNNSVINNILDNSLFSYNDEISLENYIKEIESKVNEEENNNNEDSVSQSLITDNNNSNSVNDNENSIGDYINSQNLSVDSKPLNNIVFRYNNLGNWSVNSLNPKVRLLRMKITEDIIMRESTLIRLEDIIVKLDNTYWKYALLRIKSTEGGTIVKDYNSNTIKLLYNNIITLQKETAVLIAHIRSLSIIIIENIIKLRKIFSKLYIINNNTNNISIYYNNENYLLKIKSDLNFLYNTITMRLWLGFLPHNLIIPPFNNNNNNTNYPLLRWKITNRRIFNEWLEKHENYIKNSWKSGRSKVSISHSRPFLSSEVNSNGYKLVMPQRDYINQALVHSIQKSNDDGDNEISNTADEKGTAEGQHGSSRLSMFAAAPSHHHRSRSPSRTPTPGSRGHPDSVIDYPGDVSPPTTGYSEDGRIAGIAVSPWYSPGGSRTPTPPRRDSSMLPPSGHITNTAVRRSIVPSPIQASRIREQIIESSKASVSSENDSSQSYSDANVTNAQGADGLFGTVALEEWEQLREYCAYSWGALTQEAASSAANAEREYMQQLLISSKNKNASMYSLDKPLSSGGSSALSSAILSTNVPLRRESLIEVRKHIGNRITNILPLPRQVSNESQETSCSSTEETTEVEKQDDGSTWEEEIVATLVQGPEAAPLFWGTIDHNPLVVEAATGFEEVFPSHPIVPSISAPLQRRIAQCERILEKEYENSLNLAHKSAVSQELRETVVSSVSVEKLDKLSSQSKLAGEMNSVADHIVSTIIKAAEEDAELLRLRQQGSTDSLVGISVDYLANYTKLPLENIPFSESSHIIPNTEKSTAGTVHGVVGKNEKDVFITEASHQLTEGQSTLDPSTFISSHHAHASYINPSDFQSFRVESTTKVKERIEEIVDNNRCLVEYKEGELFPTIREDKVGRREPNRLDGKWRDKQAVKIQRMVRGKLARMEAHRRKRLVKWQAVVLKIQCIVRGFIIRRKRRQQDWDAKYKTFILRKQAARRFRASIALSTFFKRIVKARREVIAQEELAAGKRKGMSVATMFKAARTMQLASRVANSVTSASPPNTPLSRSKSAYEKRKELEDERNRTKTELRNKKIAEQMFEAKVRKHRQKLIADDLSQEMQDAMSAALEKDVELSNLDTSGSILSDVSQLTPPRTALKSSIDQHELGNESASLDESVPPPLLEKSVSQLSTPSVVSYFREETPLNPTLRKLQSRQAELDEGKKLELLGFNEEAKRRERLKQQALNLVARVNRGKPQLDSIHHSRLIPSKFVDDDNLDPNVAIIKSKKLSVKEHVFIKNPNSHIPQSLITSSNDVFIGPIPKRAVTPQNTNSNDPFSEIPQLGSTSNEFNDNRVVKSDQPCEYPINTNLQQSNLSPLGYGNQPRIFDDFTTSSSYGGKQLFGGRLGNLNVSGIGGKSTTIADLLLEENLQSGNIGIASSPATEIGNQQAFAFHNSIDAGLSSNNRRNNNTTMLRSGSNIISVGGSNHDISSSQRMVGSNSMSSIQTSMNKQNNNINASKSLLNYHSSGISTKAKRLAKQRAKAEQEQLQLRSALKKYV